MEWLILTNMYDQSVYLFSVFSVWFWVICLALDIIFFKCIKWYTFRCSVNTVCSCDINTIWNKFFYNHICLIGWCRLYCSLWWCNQLRPRNTIWSRRTRSQSVKIMAHYDDVIMATMASQITSLTVVYSTVYSDADKKKLQSSASLAFVWGIQRASYAESVSIWWRYHELVWWQPTIS